MENNENIVFTADFKEWKENRIIDIKEDTSTKEILNMVFLIRNSIDKKIFELLPIKTKELDNFSISIMKKYKSNNYGDLSKAILEIDSKETKDIISKSSEKGFEKAAKFYLISKIISYFGIKLA